MKITILSAPPMMWYAKHLGKTFEVNIDPRGDAILTPEARAKGSGEKVNGNVLSSVINKGDFMENKNIRIRIFDTISHFSAYFDLKGMELDSIDIINGDAVVLHPTKKVVLHIEKGDFMEVNRVNRPNPNNSTKPAEEPKKKESLFDEGFVKMLSEMSTWGNLFKKMGQIKSDINNPVKSEIPRVEKPIDFYEYMKQFNQSEKELSEEIKAINKKIVDELFADIHKFASRTPMPDLGETLKKSTIASILDKHLKAMYEDLENFNKRFETPKDERAENIFKGMDFAREGSDLTGFRCFNPTFGTLPFMGVDPVFEGGEWPKYSPLFAQNELIKSWRKDTYPNFYTTDLKHKFVTSPSLEIGPFDEINFKGEYNPDFKYKDLDVVRYQFHFYLFNQTDGVFQKVNNLFTTLTGKAYPPKDFKYLYRCGWRKNEQYYRNDIVQFKGVYYMNVLGSATSQEPENCFTWKKVLYDFTPDKSRTLQPKIESAESFHKNVLSRRKKQILKEKANYSAFNRDLPDYLTEELEHINDSLENYAKGN